MEREPFTLPAAPTQERAPPSLPPPQPVTDTHRKVSWIPDWAVWLQESSRLLGPGPPWDTQQGRTGPRTGHPGKPHKKPSEQEPWARLLF